MKKHLKDKQLNRLGTVFLLALLINSIEISAQENLSLTYNHFDSVPELYDEYGIKSFSWNEGVLYLGNGKYNNNALQSSFSLTQYNHDGVKIWEKGYLYPESNRLVAIDFCSLNENFIYVSGWLTDSEDYQRFLSKIDKDGDTVFHRKYIDEGYFSLLDIEKYNEDTLMILSLWREEHDSSDYKTIIDLIDTNGNIIKTSEHLSLLKSPKRFVKYNDVIFIGGTTKSHPDSIFSRKVYIDRYDLNLNLLGSTTPSLTVKERFFDFTITEDGLLFTSKITMSTSPYYLYRTNISRISQLGVLIDTNTFGPTGMDPYFSWTTNVGEEYIATYIGEDLPKIYFHDLQMEPLCNYLIEIPHDEPVFAYLEDIKFDSTNKISGTGYIGYAVENGMNIKQWNFLSNNILTFLYENCAIVGLKENKPEQSNYRVTPTISNSVIKIESLSCNNFGIIEIRVFDLNGRLVMEKEFISNTLINVQSFGKGVHVLYLKNDGNIETHKFVVN